MRVIPADLAVGDRYIDLVPFAVKRIAGTVHDQLVAFGHDQVDTGPILGFLRDLAVGLRLAVGCKHGGRQQRYYHHQREQQRTPALELFSHSTFPPVFHHF